MLSGNGRHRRPRQAPALLVAAGVTGSAIAIPLLGAAGASAADGTVWDKVADCETDGSWSADEGGGEYGGLALAQDDWEAYGGLDFADRADLASRNQQISVAQKLLADRGVGAWGVCGLTSGLTQQNGGGSLDTGLGDGSPDSSLSSGLSDLSKGLSGSTKGADKPSDSTKSPDAEADSGDSATASSSDDADGTDASAPSSPSSGSASEAPSASDAPSGAGAGGDAAVTDPETGEADESDKSVQAEGSWSLVDTGSLDTGSLGSGRHRGATADEGKPEAADPTPAGRHAADTLGASADTYTVRAGDSLESIADSLALDGGWSALYAANADAIGSDPDDISAGQKLNTRVE